VAGLENLLLNVSIFVGLGVIGYFLKDLRFSVRESLQKHEERMSCLEEKMNDLKETLPQRFVMRDDYIRAMSGFGAKLDKTHDAIVEIAERIAAMEATHEARHAQES